MQGLEPPRGLSRPRNPSSPPRRAASQRPTRRDAAAQAAGDAGLLLGPALIGRLRDRADPPRARSRRPRAPAPDAVGRGRRRRAACDRRRLLPPDLPRLSERRRRLRGQPRQPRRERLPDRGLGAADRLRAHGGGLGRRRSRRDHERGARACPVRGRVVARLRRRPRGGEPARGQGVRARLRPADLRLRPLRAARCSPSASPRSLFGDGLTRGERRLSSFAMSPTPAASWSSSCVLRAFASGCTALTGVEAVSNGVPGVRGAEEPQRRDDAGDHGRALDHDVRRDHRARARRRRPHGRGRGEPDRAARRRGAERPRSARSGSPRSATRRRSTCCRRSPRRS